MVMFVWLPVSGSALVGSSSPPAEEAKELDAFTHSAP
jgi:hypothetical protein